WGTPTDSPLVSPDVIVRIDNGDLVVEVVDSRYNYLRMNGVYGELLTRISRQSQKDRAEKAASGATRLNEAEVMRAAQHLSPEEREHIRQLSSRARLFISNIDQRRETLLKISKVVCEFQEEFLRGGVRNLKPLTRALVAQQVGVHESTVSRATANKY